MKKKILEFFWGRSGISRGTFRSLAKQTKSEPEAFWSAFRERAVKLPRATTVKERGSLLGAPIWAAAAALLMAGVFFWRFGAGPRGIIGPDIEIVEMSSEVDSFVIWEDAEGKGTIVWFVRHDQTNIEGG